MARENFCKSLLSRSLSKTFKTIKNILFLLLTITSVCGIIYRVEYAPLAQLDRVTGYEPVGQGFESLAACQEQIDFHLSAFVFILGFEGRVLNDSPGDCQTAPQLRSQAGESLAACQEQIGFHLSVFVLMQHNIT